MLNRLKDLAQRQDDLNEKLKELENALRAAKNAAEKDRMVISRDVSERKLCKRTYRHARETNEQGNT